MTTTSRPPARKRTARTETSRTEALERGLRITLDGEAYEIRLGDVTSTVTRELRRATGMSFNQVMNLVQTDPDSDVIAAFVWMARRINGEAVDIDDVVITYTQLLGDGFDIDVAGDRSEDDGPEA
jgi:hypothetical protein